MLFPLEVIAFNSHQHLFVYRVPRGTPIILHHLAMLPANLLVLTLCIWFVSPVLLAVYPHDAYGEHQAQQPNHLLALSTSSLSLLLNNATAPTQVILSEFLFAPSTKYLSPVVFRW